VNSIGELAFLAKSFGRVRGTNLLIVAGSGQLCDNFYGVWGFPYTLLKWSVIAKLSRSKLAYLSCGAGPIDSPLSRMFIKAALLLADYRSFRDAGSRKLVEKIGVGGNNPVFPDLVFSSKLNSNGSYSGKSRIVAINPFPHCDHRYWPVNKPAEYSSYVNRLASVASWLIKNSYTVLFFPTQVRADALVIEDVKRILMKDRTLDLKRHLVVKTTATFEDLIAQLATAEIVVASRFHGVLISFLLNKPVLALSHHPKVDNLMRDMGQSDFLLDIGTFDSKTVASRIVALESRSHLVKQQIKSNVATCRGKLESQYRDVFCPM
jgi:polysaccharide pyruvyl transferase WcaK-like protein